MATNSMSPDSNDASDLLANAPYWPDLIILASSDKILYPPTVRMILEAMSKDMSSKPEASFSEIVMGCGRISLPAHTLDQGGKEHDSFLSDQIAALQSTGLIEMEPYSLMGFTPGGNQYSMTEKGRDILEGRTSLRSIDLRTDPSIGTPVFWNPSNIERPAQDPQPISGFEKLSQGLTKALRTAFNAKSGSPPATTEQKQKTSDSQSLGRK